MAEIIEFLKQNFPDHKISEMIDSEVMEWIDNDDNEAIANPFEWYNEFMNGEAEDVVRAEIVNEIVLRTPGIEHSRSELYKIVREHDERLDK